MTQCAFCCEMCRAFGDEEGAECRIIGNTVICMSCVKELRALLEIDDLKYRVERIEEN